MDNVSYKFTDNECLFLIFDSFRKIFDRGKGWKLIKGYSLFDSDYRFCFDWIFTSGSLVLNVDSDSMAYYNEIFLHELLKFAADSLFGDSVLLVRFKWILC
ncbi:hypothetical protein MKW92_038886, partial [Papaver armeniacum]